MADVPAKRYWFRWTGGIEYIESAPIEVFDKWAESLLLREGLVPSSERFGDPKLRPKPQPRIRYDRSISSDTIRWANFLNEHKDVKRRRITPDFVIPAHYPLSAFIATRYESIWDVMPPLVFRFGSLVKPAAILFEGTTVPAAHIELHARQIHTMLSRLVDTKNTACYGPVATAWYGKDTTNDGIDPTRVEPTPDNGGPGVPDAPHAAADDSEYDG